MNTETTIPDEVASKGRTMAVIEELERQRSRAEAELCQYASDIAVLKLELTMARNEIDKLKKDIEDANLAGDSSPESE